MPRRKRKPTDSVSENKSTLCWDCAKSVGFCSWSNGFIPVDGWDATYITDNDTYRVKDCPLFERDSLNRGQKRLPREPQEVK